MHFSSGTNGKQAAIATQFVHILLHAEFSATDYTLNIVSKCCFFLYIETFAGCEKVPENFSWGSGKSCFLSVKEWEH